MKNKFMFLTKDSLKSKISTKTFKIVIILLCILLVGLVNLDSVIKLFGGDFNELVNIYIIDESNVYEQINETFDKSVLSLTQSYNAKLIKTDKSLEELKKELIEEESDHIIVHITNTEEQTIKEIFNAKIISYGKIDTVLYTALTTTLDQAKTTIALSMVDIDMEMLNDINEKVPVERIILDESIDENEEMTEIIASIIMIVFILPIFMLIITVVQMIGAEINEEKSSKGMEIIISSVSPQVHFNSKLVAANLFALIQGLLLVGYGFLGCIIKVLTTGSMDMSNTLNGILGTTSSGENIVKLVLESGIVDKIVNGLPIILIMIILTFIVYTLAIGILASVTTSMEDFNQIQTPIMILLMAGYMLSIYSALFKGAVFLKVMSYIPFISGVLAPVMYMLGEVTLIDIGISIAILLATIFVLYKYGLRVYKVGILNYSSSNLWKKIFNALKQRD